MSYINFNHYSLSCRTKWKKRQQPFYRCLYLMFNSPKICALHKYLYLQEVIPLEKTNDKHERWQSLFINTRLETNTLFFHLPWAKHVSSQQFLNKLVQNELWTIYHIWCSNSLKWSSEWIRELVFGLSPCTSSKGQSHSNALPLQTEWDRERRIKINGGRRWISHAIEHPHATLARIQNQKEKKKRF